jgi:ABC-2 type transport system permease protein
MRLAGLVRKEFLQIVRDPSSIAIAFLMPVFLLLLFGYGVSLDADHLPVALVAEEPSADTADFFASLEGSHYFAATRFATQAEAEEALRHGRVNAIVHLRDDFASRLRRPDGAPIQLIVNGVDANTARLIEGLRGGRLGQLAGPSSSRSGPGARKLASRRCNWSSASGTTPRCAPAATSSCQGLLAMIMTLIGTLLTALVIAREWERGTMEALLVTPDFQHGGNPAGQVHSPTLCLAPAGWLLTVGHGGLRFFRCPCGVPSVAAAGPAPRPCSCWVALGMGFFISSHGPQSQFVAALVAMVGTFLPAFILSGFMFDIQSMPHGGPGASPIVIVARYFVAIVQTLFLAGDVWAVVLPNAAALALMAAFFLAVTWRKSRKRLE